MLPRIHLNPVTKKRIQRFKSLKRSYYSLWALGGLYLFGLIAELLCNNIPLYVRYEGSSYFPLLAYYGEDEFVEGGYQTRPDYRALARQPQFAEDDDNYMIFPLIAPYGPNEVMDPKEVEESTEVRIDFNRQEQVGSIDFAADFSIRRATAAAGFFGLEDDRALRGEDLGEYLQLSEAFRAAVEARLANQQALPDYEEKVELPDGETVELSLSAFTPRSREPSTVRLTLREGAVGASRHTVTYPRDGELESQLPPVWGDLSDEQREEILTLARTRYDKAVLPVNMSIDERQYRVSFERDQVFFPYGPTDEHVMGLDHIGRDVGVRILYALRIALNFGILLVLATMVLGVFIGGLQGYMGGRLDLLGQRFIEIWSSLPFLYVMILLGSVMGRSFWLLLFVYGIFNWIGISYYMRGEFFKLRKLPFVEAAHCIGLPGWKIMLRHMLPNGLVPIVTFFPFYLVGAIAALSALDFLGFGMPPPTPSWGELLSQAQEFKYAWWLVLYPSIALFVVVLLGVFVGEGVRAAFDPRVHSRFES